MSEGVDNLLSVGDCKISNKKFDFDVLKFSKKLTMYA